MISFAPSNLPPELYWSKAHSQHTPSPLTENYPPFGEFCGEPFDRRSQARPLVDPAKPEIQPIRDGVFVEIKNSVPRERAFPVASYEVGFRVSSNRNIDNLGLTCSFSHGDAVRSSGFELQESENDSSREREHWTHAHWTTMAPEIIVPEYRDLQQTSIYMPYDTTPGGAGVNVRQTIGETTYGQRLDRDRLLVRF